MTDSGSLDRPSRPALSGSARADVCVVGGGFTGLWTALELVQKAPGIKVVLLEATSCGDGASGANAGYLMNLWPKLSALRAISTADEATMLATASSEAQAKVLEFATTHGVECRRGPWLWAATSSAQVGSWDDTMQAIEATGKQVLKPMSAAEVAERTGARAQFGGVVDESCAVLQPAALCHALADAAVEAGVLIHEGTPVTQIECARVSRIHTDAGRVDADHVVLATNAWAAQVPGLARKMVMVASDSAMTEPIPEKLAELNWVDPISISDSRRRLNSFRTTADGRLLFGKGGVTVGYGSAAASNMWHQKVALSELQAHLRRTFPTLADAPLAATWRAPVEYSISSLPFCGRLDPQSSTWFAVGYSGDGVGPSNLMARILSSKILGTNERIADSALARVPRGSLPPEPLRWLGSKIVVPALRAAEHREDSGRSVPTPLRWIADLDPTTFVG